MSTPAQPVVLHLISSLRVGGAERLLVSTMREAAKAGQTGFVVVIMNDECDQGLVAELESTGVPLYRLGRREGHLSPKYLTAILNIIRRHGATVIHTHNEGSRSWGMLAKLARPRLRLVYTVHAEGVGATITGLRRAAYLRLVDTTVAISEAVERECRAFGAKDVVRIENGVDLEAFAAAGDINLIRQRHRQTRIGVHGEVPGRRVRRSIGIHQTQHDAVEGAEFERRGGLILNGQRIRCCGEVRGDVVSVHGEDDVVGGDAIGAKQHQQTDGRVGGGVGGVLAGHIALELRLRWSHKSHLSRVHADDHICPGGVGGAVAATQADVVEAGVNGGVGRGRDGLFRFGFREIRIEPDLDGIRAVRVVVRTNHDGMPFAQEHWQELIQIRLESAAIQTPVQRLPGVTND
ncbi:MAG: glycosyltransferase [Proteobacteria bacterium]|nr:glycosyltransferase [Pseudomonadota bacterium]